MWGRLVRALRPLSCSSRLCRPKRGLNSLSQSPPAAALVYADEFAAGYLTTLGKFAVRQRLPMASNVALLTWEGGLMSYSRSPREEWERTAEYVVRIRNGARPADLPVRRADTFQLFLNRSTAKALGLTIPPSLLQRADLVIE
jgi:putative ABC transport system substrate-binding protein